jgi:hypothetical protein
MLGAIDEWRSSQDGELSRAEALRRLAQLGLEAAAKPRRSAKRKEGE